MLPLFLLIAASLCAQVQSEVVAGRGIRSGVPLAQSGAVIDSLLEDPSGNFVFNDRSNHVIWRLTPDGIATVLVGTGEPGFAPDGSIAASAAVNLPLHPRFDAEGNLYFVDALNYRIRKVNKQGVLTTVVGNGVPFVHGMDLEGPALLTSVRVGTSDGFDVDRAGTVYFSDTVHDVYKTIRRADASGRVNVVAGRAEPLCGNCAGGDGGPALSARIPSVSLLNVDDSGRLYWGDAERTVRKVENGQVNRVTGPLLCSTISGLESDAENRVFVTCLGGPGAGGSTSGSIRAFDASGTQIPAVLPASAPPTALYRNAAGRVLVVTATELVDPLDLTKRAPKPMTSYVAAPDGIDAREAVFGAIRSIAVTRAGEVYFVDGPTCLLRKIDVANKLRTLSGTGQCGSTLGDVVGAGWLAVGPDDRVWLRGIGRTLIFGPDGLVSQLPVERDLGVEPAIAIDAKGRQYVMGANYLNRRELDGSVRPISSRIHRLWGRLHLATLRLRRWAPMPAETSISEHLQPSLRDTFVSRRTELTPKSSILVCRACTSHSPSTRRGGSGGA